MANVALSIAQQPDAWGLDTVASRIRLQTFSYRFADQVLNSNLAVKHEVESILQSPRDLSELSRPRFNEVLQEAFVLHGWQSQPPVFDEPKDPSAKMDFLKSRIGVEVEFGHSSFIGIDLLKFQVASYSGIDKIDVGVYVVTTRSFQHLFTSSASTSSDARWTLSFLLPQPTAQSTHSSQP